MFKRIAILGCLAVFIFLSAGSSATVKKEAISELKQAGLLSVNVQKVDPRTPDNVSVIQAAADYALDQIELKLKEITGFEMVPVSRYKSDPDYQNAGTIAKSEGAQAYLQAKAEKDPKFVMGANMTNSADAMQALGAMFGGGVTAEDKAKAVTNATNMTQKMLDKSREDFVTSLGMPFLPYGIFTDKDPNKVEVRLGNAPEEENVLKDVLLNGVAKLCDTLKLDGMIIVHVSTEVPPVGSVRVISGHDRVLGAVKLNMTMLLINRKGEVVADLGWPRMDGLAPSKGFLPTHRITEFDKKNEKNPVPKNFVTELKDPKGSVLNAFQELVVDSAGKMVTSFRKETGEIK